MTEYIDKESALTSEIDRFTAVGICEGFIEPINQEQLVQAWQFLIDSGLAFDLQGFFGRTARALIEAKVCTPPKNWENNEHA